MATARVQPKTATDALLDRFSELIESQSERMTDEEFKAAEGKFNTVVNRVRASRGRKRETA
jgi:hypothetical protein